VPRSADLSWMASGSSLAVQLWTRSLCWVATSVPVAQTRLMLPPAEAEGRMFVSSYQTNQTTNNKQVGTSRVCHESWVAGNESKRLSLRIFARSKSGWWELNTFFHANPRGESNANLRLTADVRRDAYAYASRPPRMGGSSLQPSQILTQLRAYLRQVIPLR